MKKMLFLSLVLLIITHLSATRFDLLLKEPQKQNNDATHDQPDIWMALKKRDPVIIARILNTVPDALSYRNSRGRTPLHIAAYKTFLPAVEMFLEQGADITARDDDKKTPLDLAKERLQWVENLLPPSIHQVNAIIRKTQNQSPTQIPRPCPYKPCKSTDFEKVIIILTTAFDQHVRTAIKTENKEERDFYE